MSTYILIFTPSDRTGTPTTSARHADPIASRRYVHDTIEEADHRLNRYGTGTFFGFSLIACYFGFSKIHGSDFNDKLLHFIAFFILTVSSAQLSLCVI